MNSFKQSFLRSHPILLLVLGLVLVALSGCDGEAPQTQAGPQQARAPDQAEKHAHPTYLCPMHPQVVSSEPGRCPICGMDLVAKEMEASPAGEPTGMAFMTGERHTHPSYVCPMHPQVVSAEPGRCPICGMDLVAKAVEPAPVGPPTHASARKVSTVTVSDAVVNQLGVRTAAVRRGNLTRHVEGAGTFLGGVSRTYRPANRASDPSPGGSTSFVITQVFEREAPWVRPGQAARVRFPTLGAREWKGTVSNIESQINPLTRTLQFRVSVDLEGDSVPGGMSALVTLEVDPLVNVLLVPREAVIVTGAGARVIVAHEGGRFEQRRVHAQDLGEDDIAIHAGLAEGEQVVVSSQFLLDSEASLQAGLSRLSGGEPGLDEAAMHGGETPEGAPVVVPTHADTMSETPMPGGEPPAAAVEGVNLPTWKMREVVEPAEATPDGAMAEATMREGSAQQGPIPAAPTPAPVMPHDVDPEGARQ